MSRNGQPVVKSGTIGQKLVDRGSITVEQLERAIEAQVIFGGRLGTALLELGYLDEVTLNAVLSEKHGVPTLDKGVVDPAPAPDTLALIPRELAKEYRVLPLRRDGTRLHLLMEDPTDLQNMDDLSFRIGLSIVPHVVAEARIAFLLEKYYGVRRESRLIQLTEDGVHIQRPPAPEDSEADADLRPAQEEQWEIDEAEAEELRALVGADTDEGDLIPEELHRNLMAGGVKASELSWEMSDVPEQAGPAKAPETAAATHKPLHVSRPEPETSGAEPPLMRETVQPPPPVPEPAVAPPAPKSAEPPVEYAWEIPKDRAAEAGPGITAGPPEVVVRQGYGKETPVRRAARKQKVARGARRVPPLSVNEAAARLRAVEERQQVARILLAFARGRCRRAALLIFQRGAFLGWDGAGEGVDCEAMQTMRLHADKPSMFRTASMAGSHVLCALGEIPEGGVHETFLAALGGGAPKAALLIPIIVNDRVVNVFYADNGPGSAPPRDVRDFLEVTRCVPDAFARLLRKRKAMVK